VVAVEAVNDPGKPDEPLADQSNPAGLIVELVARVDGNDVARGDQSMLRVSSGRAWRWSAERSEGWTGRDFDDARWKPAVELGQPDCAPWGLGDRWRIAASSAARVGRVRVALMSNDPLLTALGRPNREQVVTSRPTVATTLQALELTNGETLAGWLRKGAAQLLNEEPDSAEALVSEVYRRALGRAPSAEEEGLARLLVGAEPEPAGVEDLLWAMIMLPEFQLIQ
jgi:hypothetical protein